MTRRWEPKTAEEKAWRARADRFRKGRNWCELCEWRTVHLIGDVWVIRARLEVHHGFGRGHLSPVGQEYDFELHVLCRRCHARITRRQFQLAVARGCCGRDRSIVDAEGYARCVREATERASVRRWARGWHRTLLGPVADS